MAKYQSRHRPGLITSATIDPMLLESDMYEKIMEISPDATPLITLSSKLPKGKPPISHKVYSVQKFDFNHHDYISEAKFATNPAWGRFALVHFDQISRPDIGDMMFYYPQDTFYIIATGQQVSVVMTPTASVRISESDNANGFFKLPAAGAQAFGLPNQEISTTPAGWVLVRNVEPAPIKEFKSTDVIYQGRTIFESQGYEAQPIMTDYVYDVNLVEHFETKIAITEDQKEWVRTKGTVPPLKMAQEDAIKILKGNVERKFLFGIRHEDLTIPGKPMRYMNGGISAVKTNIMYYNPHSVDVESMLINYILECSHRTIVKSPNKITLCGRRLLAMINRYFADYRRNNSMELKGKVGLNMETYDIMGFTLTFIPTDLFTRGTPLEYWAFTFEPACAEVKVVPNKNFTTVELPRVKRDYEWVIEFQGTIAWHAEQANSLLRTV